MNDRQRPPSRVSLEELLQLKRAERPSADFWAKFDANLRHKQLSAIVDRRPWWRTWMGVSTKAAWVSVPAGVAALVAFSFSVARVSQSKNQGAPEIAKVAISLPNPVTENSASLVPARVEIVEEIASTAPHSSPLTSESASLGKPQREQLIATANTYASAQDAIHSTSGITDRFDQLNRSTVDASLSTQPSTFVSALSNHTESATVPATLKVAMADDPLSHLTPPREARRSRMLAQLSDGSSSPLENARVVRSRERITNHLTEQALYDSISRLGLNGDRVFIKF